MSKKIVVAGHQPNFFPWFGYFEKMLKSDIFVFSDDVQYPKQCYVNRVEIPISGSPAHLILPVSKGSDVLIANKRFQKDPHVLKKIIKTIKFNLGGLPFFHDLESVIEEFSTAFSLYETIADINIHMNRYIAVSLGITPQIYLGTALQLESYHKNERLIRRCELLKSSIYLCGQGADDYQDESMLNKAGIVLKRIDYEIGKSILGEDLRYSILFAIAKYGVSHISNVIDDYKVS